MEPHFLTLKFSDHADDWGAAATGMRGQIMASANQSAVTPLEPGTAHSGLVIVRFPFAADLDSFWASSECRSLRERDSALVALACAGLPWEGWPGHFVPTIATVDVPASEAPRIFMVIEGTGTDQDRMDRYRDMILPMLRERGAYYVAFELGGNVRVLAGQWREGIFAVSRWPSRSHAEDFWFSERYQSEAVPIRTGVGRFDVQIVDGIAG